MIQAFNKKPQKAPLEERKNLHTFIKKPYKVVEYDEETGARTEKTLYKEIDITRKMNETKKLIKSYTAEEKIAELEKIFSK